MHTSPTAAATAEAEAALAPPEAEDKRGRRGACRNPEHEQPALPGNGGQPPRGEEHGHEHQRPYRQLDHLERRIRKAERRPDKRRGRHPRQKEPRPEEPEPQKAHGKEAFRRLARWAAHAPLI